MIHVLADIHVADGRRDEFLEIFGQLVPKVRAEAGCIEYVPTIDVESPVEAQAPLRDNVVTVVEKWESVAALEDHIASPHVKAYQSQVKDIVTGLTLRILQPAVGGAK